MIMSSSYTLCLATIALILCLQSIVRAESHFNDAEVNAHKHIKVITDAFLGGNIQNVPVKKSSMVQFSFSDCGPKTEAASIESLEIKPDPIKLPGNLTFSGSANITQKFGKPLTASLEVHKKFLGMWIKVPCIDNIGSCTYTDICDKLNKAVGNKCPPALVKQGFNCKCPFAPKFISVKNLSAYVKTKIPSIADGEIKAQVKVTSGSTYITCVQVEVKLE